MVILHPRLTNDLHKGIASAFSPGQGNGAKRAGIIATILNLGDHFSGPLAAAETARLLESREMISIRGNHDRWLIEQDRAHMGASDAAAFDQLRLIIYFVSTIDGQMNAIHLLNIDERNA